MEEIEKLRMLVNERLCAAAEEILALFGRTMAQYQQEIHDLRQQHEHTVEMPISPLSAAWISNLCDDDDDDQHQPQCDEDQPQITDHREIKLECDAADVQPQMCGTSQPSSDLQLVSPQPSEDTEDSEDYSRDADDNPPCGSAQRKRRKAKTQAAPVGVASESPARSGQEEQADTLGLVSPLTRCRVCGESFQKKRTFMRHVQIHSSECGVCGKHLDLTESLDVHLQVHRTCDFCGKHFEDIMDLERHVRTHTGQKALDCSVCGKGFSNREALVKHMGAHSSDGRTFRCDVCNQTFTLGGNLKQHMKIHTGERPHGCTFCGKTFRLRATLARHVKSHTGEKPHSCAYCGRGFIEKGNLKVHMRTHTGETPYKCCMCGKRFKQLSCFYKHSCHQAAQHGDRVLPYYTKDDQ